MNHKVLDFLLGNPDATLTWIRDLDVSSEEFYHRKSATIMECFTYMLKTYTYKRLLSIIQDEGDNYRRYILNDFIQLTRANLDLTQIK